MAIIIKKLLSIVEYLLKTQLVNVSSKRYHTHIIFSMMSHFVLWQLKITMIGQTWLLQKQNISEI